MACFVVLETVLTLLSLLFLCVFLFACFSFSFPRWGWSVEAAIPTIVSHLRSNHMQAVAIGAHDNVVCLTGVSNEIYEVNTKHLDMRAHTSAAAVHSSRVDAHLFVLCVACVCSGVSLKRVIRLPMSSPSRIVPSAVSVSCPSLSVRADVPLRPLPAYCSSGVPTRATRMRRMRKSSTRIGRERFDARGALQKLSARQITV